MFDCLKVILGSSCTGVLFQSVEVDMLTDSFSTQTAVAIITFNFTVHPSWNVEADGRVFHLNV